MNANVELYERLGVFYLGRRYDPKSGETAPAPLLYDSKDLSTHAAIIGMTGSGKTGLGITLLEEAAIDGIPALVVDPKGDLTNLLLTFPDLEAKDFRPFVHPDEATRQGMDADQFAAAQADLWRQGLARWDQDGDRIRRLRQAAEVAVYTPGSAAGLPISILSSFGAPPPEVRADRDLFGERVEATTASLLALMGIAADPIKSRETILVSNILQKCWTEGKDLDLGGLIQSIQDPPMTKVGVLPLESFYPAGDRFELAMALNNLLASPGFAAWLEGEPLDVDRLLYTPTGKPRLAVLSIAHLSDAERMFFVSLLLNETLGWMRGRSGTSSLRAVLYMDEVFGYLPPVGNPPSKKPLLTLLKQARAFGLGLVLATQNPVDLDYKALSNIGTWFLGRLQTERDKDRVMDGLTSGDGARSRSELEHLLSGIDKRVFLLHNVHDDEPVLFKVRWAMSYLRGPLDRAQLKALMADARREAAEAPAPARVEAAAVEEGRPLLPPEVEERFLAPRKLGEVLYRPALGGVARVHYADSRLDVETSEEVFLLASFEGDELDWEAAQELAPRLAAELEDAPVEEARFAALPGDAGDAKSYKAWTKSLQDVLYRGRRYTLHRHKGLKLVAEPGEGERAFRIRIAEAAREERDRESEKLREKYARRFKTLEDRVRRAEQKLEVEREQAKSKKLETVVAVGTSILGAFLGRKSATLSRAKSAMRGVGRSYKESQDVDRAEENLEVLQEELQVLDQELRRELDLLAVQWDTMAAELETVELKPRRTDVEVRQVALVWTPWVTSGDVAEAAWPR